jgi:adenylate cyclase
VLPFTDLSPAKDQECFCDGMTDELINAMAQVPGLRVAARTSAFRFKGHASDIRQVGNALNVATVLDGSVRKDGDRLRITVELIGSADGYHRWSERFDRNLEDVFAIQDEITKEIVAALKLKLLPEEKKAIEQRGTTSAEAYNFYLLARQYWVGGNHGDPRREERVMRICSHAVEIDPRYGQAWALLALAQSSLCYGFSRKVDDGFAAAHAALSIDPTIAEAHLPLVKRLERRRSFNEADAQMEVALALGPDSWEVNKEAGRLSLSRRNFEKAGGHYEKAVEAMETDFHAWAMLATCYRATGQRDRVKAAAIKMVSEAEKAVQQDPSNGAAMGILAGGHALLGDEVRSREWINRAVLIDPENVNMRYNFACVLAGHLGDEDGALKMLGRVLATASETIVRIAETDPDFDPIRNSSRFQALLQQAKKRLGLTATESHAPH